MRRVFPPATDPEPAPDREWELSELADSYAYPDWVTGSGTGWLRANMVSSLDGAAHHDGRSRPLSCDADMRVFGVLRALADVIVVGAETVREERYRPARRREAFARRRADAGQTAVPAIAVVSASLKLDFTMPLFTEPAEPTIIVTGAAAPASALAAANAAGIEVVTAGEGAGADPHRVKAELARRGLPRMLTEGGPRLLGQFASAGVLDELCLSIAPRLAVGTAPRIMSGPEVTVPQELSLAGVLEDSGFLFTRYRRV